MFKSILVPIDLEHTEKLEKALALAADLGRHEGARLTFVGITTALPGPVAHNPQEFAGKLEAFAAAQAEKSGLETAAKAYLSHDPSIDFTETLRKAIEEVGADLVVMATHIPGAAEHLFASHGGSVAAHAKISVFLVR